MSQAIAIIEVASTVTVLCPFGKHTHEHAAGTGRLTTVVPAPCCSTKSYTISGTMSEKSLVCALCNRQYDLGKKRRAREAKKAAAAAQTPGQGVEA